MKQWNGLMKKEWVSMKGWFYGIVGATILNTLVLPFFIATFFKEAIDGVITSIVPFWTMASLIIPIIILLNSLKKEIDRPDIWLHSSASIFKLFGSKVVFAGFVGAVNLIIATFVALIQLKFIFPVPGLIFSGVFGIGTEFIFAAFFVSLMAMCMVLFIRVLYLVIKPYIGVLTVPVLIVFLFGASWVYERMKETTIYEKITAFGPIGSPLKDGFYIKEEDFFFEMTPIMFHLGNLLLNASFTVLLFVTAAVLFEKKVRL